MKYFKLLDFQIFEGKSSITNVLELPVSSAFPAFRGGARRAAAAARGGHRATVPHDHCTSVQHLSL
jgi:hypothetical protein